MIQTLENFLRPKVERQSKAWSQYLALAELVVNNVVNMATRYNPFNLKSGDHPFVPSIFMHGEGFLNLIEALQTMVDWMKSALEEA